METQVKVNKKKLKDNSIEKKPLNNLLNENFNDFQLPFEVHLSKLIEEKGKQIDVDDIDNQHPVTIDSIANAPINSLGKKYYTTTPAFNGVFLQKGEPISEKYSILPPFNNCTGSAEVKDMPRSYSYVDSINGKFHQAVGLGDLYPGLGWVAEPQGTLWADPTLSFRMSEGSLKIPLMLPPLSVASYLDIEINGNCPKPIDWHDYVLESRDKYISVNAQMQFSNNKNSNKISNKYLDLSKFNGISRRQFQTDFSIRTSVYLKPNEINLEIEVYNRLHAIIKNYDKSAHDRAILQLQGGSLKIFDPSVGSILVGGLSGTGPVSIKSINLKFYEAKYVRINPQLVSQLIQQVNS